MFEWNIMARTLGAAFVSTLLGTVQNDAADDNMTLRMNRPGQVTQRGSIMMNAESLARRRIARDERGDMPEGCKKASFDAHGAVDVQGWGVSPDIAS